VSLRRLNCKGCAAISYLGIRLDFEPARTQVAFAPKRVDWRRVVISDFLLFRIVTDAHPDVTVACAAIRWLRSGTRRGFMSNEIDVPPYVERKFKSHN
jgi:hypothetical protein